MKGKTFDEQLKRAKKVGELANQSEPRAESARYDSCTKRVVVRLRNGEDFSFSPEWVPGLRGASAFDLANIEVTPSGAGLHWEALDEDLSVPALLQGMFGPADAAGSALPVDAGIFEDLCCRIETDWTSRGDATVVDRLASEHPEYSADLYDFFALLIESELDLPEAEEHRQTSENTLAWLEKEGFELVQKIVREQVGETPETTPATSAVSQPETSENAGGDDEQQTNQPSRPLGYIGLAQERTGLEIEQIEKKAGFPAAVVKFVQRQPAHELRPVRREIIRRGKAIGIEEAEGEEALNYQVQRAAKRGAKKTAPVSKSVTEQFKELIEKIPMSKEERKFWINLSREDENL